MDFYKYSVAHRAVTGLSHLRNEKRKTQGRVGSGARRGSACLTLDQRIFDSSVYVIL